MDLKMLGRLKDGGVYTFADLEKKTSQAFANEIRRYCDLPIPQPAKAKLGRAEVAYLRLVANTVREMPDRKGATFGGRLGDRVRIRTA